MNLAVLVALGALMLLAAVPTNAQVRSRSFVYAPSQSWENTLAHASLDLTKGAELELETGDRPDSAAKVGLEPSGSAEVSTDGSKSVVHMKSSDGSLAATITYTADPKWPIMHKFVDVTNTGSTSVRLLNVVLGRIPVGGAKTEGGARGFPLYLDMRFFVSLAHPGGFAHVEGQDVVLRQYPGVKLAPGETFHSMEAVYGVAKTGGARKLFVDYVRSRMARVKYGHDKPYAILEAFGGQPDGDFKVNFSVGIAESYLLKHLAEVERSERRNGVQFDFYSIEFWNDRAGDLTTFNRQNFPNGFDRVRDNILALGMKPGLWIDSGGLPDWTIDLNPAIKGCWTEGDGKGVLCRASEPLNQMYKDAFSYQARVNKAGLFKFDNLGAGTEGPECNNPAHDHLPGPHYSVEAIYNAVIGFLQTLRKASPDTFIMLYWGYCSPWWLQYGDTYFECGEHIEAASPAQYPTPYARDAVTQRLDQAQMQIVDTPWLGKDSLGVWLSDWAWNSGIGKARWQGGVIMDIARGSLLLQIWTDADWLTPPERDEVATFINLLKANPACFDNSRPIIGDPNKAQPYGYSCCDGKKAFLAINNACLKDNVVKLDLGTSWGLSAGRKWDVYRWYPHPARLTGTSLALRPYEVALLEVVPAGDKPSLGRSFPDDERGTAFAEKTTALAVTAHVQSAEAGPGGHWAALKPSSASAVKASLAIRSDGSVLAAGENAVNDAYTVTVKTAAKRITGIMLETLTDDSLPTHGPGRAVNGNFALTSIHVKAAPNGHLDQIQDVGIRAAQADFSQTSFGGWPVAAAIDADAKTGWSIHPEVGEPHAAVFTFDKPLDMSGGAVLAVTLVGGENGHNLGRFRLSVTEDPMPSLPIDFQPGIVVLSGDLPATKTGGLLFLVGGSAEDAMQATVGGQAVSIVSVWKAESNWGCPWVAWRAEVGPSDTARPFRIRLERRQTQAAAAFTGYFLPR